jgi:DNA-binding SARP family transcriptional activator
VEFRLLGPLELIDDEGQVVGLPAGKPRALLALLLLEAGQPVSVDRIVDGLWGERAPATAANAVRGYVSRVRKLLGEGRLLTCSPGYLLQTEPESVDVLRFERVRREAAVAAGEGRWQQAAELLGEALSLWRGAPLAEFKEEPFARVEAGRMEQLRLAVLEDRFDADLALGRHGAIVSELDTLIEAHPHRERLRGQLMLALYRSGRQTDALRAYREAREALDELGVEPAAPLRELERRILTQDPALDRPHPRLLTPAVAGRVPLPGPLLPASPFPFVGRLDELVTLRALIERTEQGEGGLALVAGEAGAGKTRLVRELAHEVAGRGVFVCYGISDASVTSAYQPLLEWLEFLLRVCDPDVLRDCLGADGNTLTRLVPELSRLTEAPSPDRGEIGRLALQRAVTELLTRMSRVQPLLLVVDDLHWADGETLHLLRRLARTAPEARLLVLAAYRNRGEEIGPAFADTLADLSRLDAVTRLSLDNLSAEEVSAFIRGSTGADPPAELAAAIGELTDGTPLLLCELWRDLLEGGTVEVSHTVRLTRPLAELRGPERVRDVVRQRLARLAPETTALLELAAVAGARVQLPVLAAASGCAPSALGSAVEEGVRGGMIEELSEPALTYRFAHELVRRAVYERVTGLRRTELHLRVGEALERSHVGDPSRVLSELAHHFTIAAPLGGVERAVGYNLRAADAATAAGAYDEAAARLSAALELGVSDPRQRARVKVELARLFAETGRRPQANAILSAVLDAAAGLKDRGLAAEAVLELLGRQAGDPQFDSEAMRRDAEAAIEVFLQLGDRRGLARARRRRALAWEYEGRWSEACADLERARVDADACGDQDMRRWVIGSLARALCHGPTPVGEAICRCQELRAQHPGDRVLEAIVTRCLSSLYAMAGRFDDARDSVERSSLVLDRLDRRTASAIYRTHSAEARELLGDVAGARKELLARWHLKAGWDHTPDLRAMASAYYVALLYCDDGCWVDAERCLDYGRDVPVPHSFRTAFARGLAARARVAAHRGDLVEALKLARGAVELAGQSDDLNLRARVWLALAEVLRANGNGAEADIAVATAARLYEAKGNVAAATSLRAAAT